jgi:hypothetical protein
MKEDVVIPELAAYRDRDCWKVYCRWCEVYHHHRQLGLNAAKCPAFTEYVPTGYILVNSGWWSPSKVVRYGKHRL